MRHVASVVLAAGLAATMLGCGSTNEDGKKEGGKQETGGAKMTLVKLKVPNMT